MRQDLNRAASERGTECTAGRMKFRINRPIRPVGRLAAITFRLLPVFTLPHALLLGREIVFEWWRGVCSWSEPHRWRHEPRWAPGRLITASPTWRRITQHFLILTHRCRVGSHHDIPLAGMLRRQISLLVLSDARAIRPNREPRAVSARNTTVTAHVRLLRRKLDNGIKPLIRTVAGTGYKIDLTERRRFTLNSIKPKLLDKASYRTFQNRRSEKERRKKPLAFAVA
jgi:hypothetical protein